MTPHELESFEQFLSESFAEGVRFRELRLSADELKYVITKYPCARLQQAVTKEYADGKVWVGVTL